MGHGHSHEHHHADLPGSAADLPVALDPSVPDEELAPSDLSRRGFLRGAGLVGAGAAAGSVLAGAGAAHAHDVDGNPIPHPQPARTGGLLWLAGDHHIHTQYSGDGLYRVIDHARHAAAYGLNWMVITDHGGAQHARIGVEKVNPDIVAARDEVPETLIFQGLEWNIPAAEHATVFVTPGPNEVAVLKEFENAYDGSVTGTSTPSAANEALAVAGITFLADQVRARRVAGALFLANHPARRGIDSPHEIRAWRDAAPSVAVGFEGAPGHQAAGIAKPLGAGSGRGFYDNAPSAASFPGYPLESYRTWGGFDWMTAIVGGLWDSLLAEGKPWWITANSDSHVNYGETATRGPGSDFATNGFYNDPVYGQPTALAAGDFWPGYYSRTHVGASSYSYRAVMDGMRAGRVWVDHGGLIAGLDVRVKGVGRGPQSVTLGGVYQPKRGTEVEVVIAIDLAGTPNWAQFVPALARVDVIAGDVTGPAADRDTFAAPTARVVKSFEVTPGSRGRITFRYSFGAVDRPFYLRLRGTDGNRVAPATAADPAGPALDVVGDADPWRDLWFYANPIWVLPR